MALKGLNLLNLVAQKSPGPHVIPNAFLKCYAEWVFKYRCIIFSSSLNTGVLPHDWKVAKVIPIHNAEPNQFVKNYRPISLTSTCCELLEHVIAFHINNYLNEQCILTNAQHGFRMDIPTSRLVQTIHDFSSTIFIFFLDFTKAFDKNSHSKLLLKLCNFRQY